MASGKQLSFQYGEVAPSQHFKSDAVNYSQGLRKLKNMFVRRDGGVSNRSGFRMWSYPADWQYDVTSLYNIRRIKTFVFGSTEYTVVKESGGNRLYVDGVELTDFYYEGANRTGGRLVPPDPDSVRFTATKDGVFITPSCTFSGCTIVGGFDINGMSANVFISAARAYVVQKNEVTAAGFSGTKGFTGIAPYLPASYLLTATMLDGREVKVHAAESTGFTTGAANSSATNPGGNTLCYPHVEMTSNITLTFTSANDILDVKFFNLYRASGQQGVGQSFYKLAARIPNVGGTVFSFVDYGADDPGQTAPLDVSSFPGTAFHARAPFNSATVACYYQQRLMLTGPSIPGIKPGEAIASALGAPRQLAAPIISSNTGAFKFSVPITDGSAIVAMLQMERALLMTSKGVYITRGGEQGILTPSTVNPLKISDEGCVGNIEPTMSGKWGFWVNAARTKLMGAEFSVDGNVNVGEASLLSNHFLKRGIVQLESIGGEEDCVFLVTKDGKLVRATVNDEGVFGFSLYETTGFVESVYRTTSNLSAPDGSGSTTPQVLMCYVIRNGTRFKEVIWIREDRFKDQELFADCALFFGSRLMLDNNSVGAPGYFKSVGWMPWPLWAAIDDFGNHINIEPPVAVSHTWEANQTIKIRTNVDLFTTFAEQDFVIHFYYDETDADGEYVMDENGRRRVKTLRYVIDLATPAVTIVDVVAPPWAYTALTREYQGYFTSDVPEVLQNVRGQYTTADYEFFLGQTRWSPAFNEFRVLVTATIPLALVESVACYITKILQVASGGDPLVVVGEGEILSSPNNPNRLDTISIEVDGSDYVIDFGEYYSCGYIGLPYESEMETLDIETGDNRTLTDSKKLINKVGFGVIETRGGFYGIPGKDLEEMEEAVFREDGDITQQTQNKNGHLEVNIPTEWTEGGRITIKNVDPVPMTIVSVYPKGIAGD